MATRAGRAALRHCRPGRGGHQVRFDPCCSFHAAWHRLAAAHKTLCRAAAKSTKSNLLVLLCRYFYMVQKVRRLHACFTGLSCHCVLTVQHARLLPSLAPWRSRRIGCSQVEGIPISSDGVVSLQWLAEGKDGIYRPTAGIYQEKVTALAHGRRPVPLHVPVPASVTSSWCRGVCLALMRARARKCCRWAPSSPCGRSRWSPGAARRAATGCSPRASTSWTPSL